MIVVVLTSIGVALGLVGFVVAFRPATAPIATALARLEADLEDIGDRLPNSARRRPDRVLGSLLARRVEASSLWSRALKADLAITGSSLETLCSECLLAGAAAALLAPTAWTVAALGGVRSPIVLPVWAGLVGAAAGMAFPVLALRSQAAKARREARAVLGTYLDLVILCLAGGMGIEGGLLAAAQISDSSTSGRILAALTLARTPERRPGLRCLVWGAPSD